MPVVLVTTVKLHHEYPLVLHPVVVTIVGTLFVPM